jgi:two-component system chemotaxis response regulator CheB
MAGIDGAVVALQNLPPTFCDAFAQYLSERCGCPASPINRKTPLSAGRCYVGIHGCPLVMKVSGRQPVIDPNGPGNGRASLDQFLLTAASVFKQRLAVVLLSGANTGEQSGIRAVHENGGQIILRNRLTSLVAEPLDQVVEAGLADEEVNPADLVKTIVTGFVPKN